MPQGLGLFTATGHPIDSPFLSQPTRFPGLSLFWELLHRKRSHGLSLFSKREYGEAGREFVKRRELEYGEVGREFTCTTRDPLLKGSR